MITKVEVDNQLPVYVLLFLVNKYVLMASIDKRDGAFEELVGHISALIEKSREHVKTVVNTTMVVTNYAIGYYIVEFEQGGHTRAAYGKEILKKLSKRLTDKYGEGWSEEQLKLTRKFYMSYANLVNSVYQIKPLSNAIGEERDSNDLVNTVCQILGESERCERQIPIPSFSNVLSWSHYLILMRIKNPEERRFYEIEAVRQQWIDEEEARLDNYADN